MITIKHERIYKLTLTVSKRSTDSCNAEYFYLLMDEHLAGKERGDHFVRVHEIFDWLEKNTRQYVPYKKVYGHPSFRAHKDKRGDITVITEWRVDKHPEEDFEF